MSDTSSSWEDVNDEVTGEVVDFLLDEFTASTANAPRGTDEEVADEEVATLTGTANGTEIVSSVVRYWQETEIPPFGVIMKDQDKTGRVGATKWWREFKATIPRKKPESDEKVDQILGVFQNHLATQCNIRGSPQFFVPSIDTGSDVKTYIEIVGSTKYEAIGVDLAAKRSITPIDRLKKRIKTKRDDIIRLKQATANTTSSSIDPTLISMYVRILEKAFVVAYKTQPTTTKTLTRIGASLDCTWEIFFPSNGGNGGSVGGSGGGGGKRGGGGNGSSGGSGNDSAGGNGNDESSDPSSSDGGEGNNTSPNKRKRGGGGDRSPNSSNCNQANCSINRGSTNRGTENDATSLENKLSTLNVDSNVMSDDRNHTDGKGSDMKTSSMSSYINDSDVEDDDDNDESYKAENERIMHLCIRKWQEMYDSESEADNNDDDDDDDDKSEESFHESINRRDTILSNEKCTSNIMLLESHEVQADASMEIIDGVLLEPHEVQDDVTINDIVEDCIDFLNAITPRSHIGRHHSGVVSEVIKKPSGVFSVVSELPIKSSASIDSTGFSIESYRDILGAVGTSTHCYRWSAVSVDQ